MATLERPEILDILSDSRSSLDRALPTPGEAAAGALALVARYTQLFGAAVLVAVMLSPLAGLVVGVTALVIRFGQRGSLGRFAGLWHGLAGQRRAMTYVREFASSPAAAKDIRIFGLRDWLRQRERAEATAYLAPLWEGRRRILFRPFLRYAAVGLVGGCLALALLARAAGNGQLSLLELAVAIQAVLIPMRFGVFFPESDVQTQYGLQGYHSLTRFEATAHAERATGSTRGSSAPDTVREGIRFEKVSFRYGQDGPDVLRELDLDLPAGTSTAVVGLNGAGKTTLVKLLARLYDPTSGRITVDGSPLTDIDPRDWQARLSIIFQDYVRYDLSAAENIAHGAPAARHDRDGIRDAARRAGVLPALDALPEGLDTILSRRYPGGRDLSGGQWQRVALARAFFAVRHGAPVLVLDEPTAQLDVRAEVEFYDQFLETTAGLTSVIISHRFSTVRRADQIVLIENGQVVERGSHDDLIALGGRYAHLFHLQAQRFEEPDAALEPMP